MVTASPSSKLAVPASFIPGTLYVIELKKMQKLEGLSIYTFVQIMMVTMGSMDLNIFLKAITPGERDRKYTEVENYKLENTWRSSKAHNTRIDEITGFEEMIKIEMIKESNSKFLNKVDFSLLNAE